MFVPQGSEVQSALALLPADRRHPGFPKPSAGSAAARRHLRGALPQLHPGAAADAVPRTHLRPGAGEIQGGAAAELMERSVKLITH